MITIRRGARPELAPPPQVPSAILLRTAAAPAPPVPWGALRAFLAQLRRHLGDEQMERAMERAGARPLLGLVLRGQGAGGSGSLGGLALGELPNVALRPGPLYAAWRDLFAALLAGRRAVLFVPELEAIDLQSLFALRPILSALRGHAELDLVLGHDPSLVHGDPLDALLRAVRTGQGALLEALPRSRVEPVSPASIEGAALPFAAPVDPWDDQLEARAFAALRDPSAGAKIDLARQALRASFDAFGFDAAVWFASALERAGAATRESRALGALALHNLAPLSKEPWVGERLVAAFEELAASEPDPRARAHWEYRLALAHGRTRGALDAALQAADAAVADAEAAPGTDLTLFTRAWTRNGRAYVRTRRGDLAGAAADAEEGVRLLTGEPDLAAPPGGLPAAEVRIARILVSNNRARIAHAAGDPEALGRWRAATSALLEATPPGERPGQQWFLPPVDERDLASAVAYFDALLEQARAALDPETEAVAAHGLGVVLYKLGDAEAAYEAFATSLRVWRITGGFPEDLLTEELNCAVSAFRSGQVTRAEEGFLRLRASPLMQAGDAQAETLAALGMIAAKAGDGDVARVRGDEATRLAEAEGARDVLVRVLRSAAEAYLLLGDREGARRAAGRALATTSAMEAAGEEGPPEDVLGAIVTALDAGDARLELVRRAIALAPAALADANAWWDAPRLAPYLGAERGDPELADFVREIDRAIDQRARRPPRSPRA